MNLRPILPDEPIMDLAAGSHPRPVTAGLMSYLFIAVAALLAGLILGSLSAPTGYNSRVGWPPPTNPRALSP